MSFDYTAPGMRDAYRGLISNALGSPSTIAYREVLDPTEALDRARDRRTRAFITGIENMVEAILPRLPDPNKVTARTRELGAVFQEAGEWANVLGQERFLIELDARIDSYSSKGLPVGFASKFVPADKLARVEFVEATSDIVARRPEIKRGFKAVQDFYNEHHGFALARSTQIKVTERVQDLVAQALRQGTGLPSFAEAVQQLAPWSKAYAETIFRTQLASDFTAGRMRQAFSPELDDFIPAFRRAPVGDLATRDNHNFTLVAAKRDAIWLTYSTPGGYN